MSISSPATLVHRRHRPSPEDVPVDISIVDWKLAASFLIYIILLPHDASVKLVILNSIWILCGLFKYNSEQVVINVVYN